MVRKKEGSLYPFFRGNISDYLISGGFLTSLFAFAAGSVSNDDQLRHRLDLQDFPPVSEWQFMPSRGLCALSTSIPLEAPH
ncbi:uncharacterized protein ARMOST_21511 [Armillaria ostoyae]|uniref:Uncharacterized protein n=1 Tax=Armillaria ostoyae TaxID=47428 RepID=A0A284SAA4_ARMOS|nr:uncharacterized protein ARMOST_21511 [Armillaria ostoyae]